MLYTQFLWAHFFPLSSIDTIFGKEVVYVFLFHFVMKDAVGLENQVLSSMFALCFP